MRFARIKDTVENVDLRGMRVAVFGAVQPDGSYRVVEASRIMRSDDAGFHIHCSLIDFEDDAA